MTEPMSDARIEHIGSCLDAPCDTGLAEMFARELLAEAKRARAVEAKLRTTIVGEHGRIGQDLDNAEEVARLRKANYDLVKGFMRLREHIASNLERISNRHDQDAERYADERSPLLQAQAEALWDAAWMVRDGEEAADDE